MTRQSFYKVAVALGVLAVLLIFLGVNYVPRIFAFSPASGSVMTAQQIRDVGAARWQALGDAYTPVNLSARQADSARWQALGTAYFAVNLRARQADTARWQALGESYSTVNLRARQADVARWQALGQSYFPIKPWR